MLALHHKIIMITISVTGSLAANKSLFAIYDEMSLIFDFRFPNQVDWAFLVANFQKTYFTQTFYRTFNYQLI